MFLPGLGNAPSLGGHATPSTRYGSPPSNSIPSSGLLGISSTMGLLPPLETGFSSILPLTPLVSLSSPLTAFANAPSNPYAIVPQVPWPPATTFAGATPYPNLPPLTRPATVILNRGAQLRSYQVELVKFLYQRLEAPRYRGGVLAVEMGLGKTLVSLFYIASRLHANPGPTLVVSSLTVMESWLNDIPKFFGDHFPLRYFVMHKDYIKRLGLDPNRITPEYLSSYDLVLTNYESITKSAAAGLSEARVVVLGANSRAKKPPIVGFRQPHVSQLAPFPVFGKGALVHTNWASIFVDEGHALTTTNTGRYPACLSLITSGAKFILSGTPIKNSDADMGALLMFCGYDVLNHPKEWRQTDYNPAAQELVKRLSRKDAGIILPELTRAIHRVAPTADHRAIYKFFFLELWGNYRKATEKVPGAKRENPTLGLLILLREIAIAPWLITSESSNYQRNQSLDYNPQPTALASSPDPEHQRLEREVHSLGRMGVGSAKMQEMCVILNTIIPTGDKVVIFASFGRALRLAAISIQNYFPGTRFEILDGQVADLQERHNILRRFRTQPTFQILLTNINMSGQGLNLEIANRAIFLDTWWNSTISSQAIDRLHRPGQLKEVFVYFLITAGTIEEFMREIICLAKQEISDNYDKNSDAPRDIVVSKANQNNLKVMLERSWAAIESS